MEHYKITFIHGDQFENKGLFDGLIENYGIYGEDSLHIANLTEYANKMFPEYSVFKQSTIRHQPEVASYLFTQLGIIVFLNMTRYDEKNLQKYGKMGTFLLPDELTKKQEESLKEFAKTISDFDVSLNYDLFIDNGLLDSKMIQSSNHESPLELVNVYLNRKKNKQGPNLS